MSQSERKAALLYDRFTTDKQARDSEGKIGTTDADSPHRLWNTDLTPSIRCSMTCSVVSGLSGGPSVM